jgi:succinate dehydrogenase / fumarate reductase cytochrome b subunit
MTLPQLAFLLALATVLILVVLFGVLVVLAAARNAGEPDTARGLLARLARAPRDRLELGRWAYWAHRVSGVAIFAFLGLHLVDVSLYAISPALYDEVHVLYGTLGMRLFESALLVAILFHTLNGLRLIALDLVDAGPPAVGRSLVVVVVATVLVGLWGSAIILAPALAGAG